MSHLFIVRLDTYGKGARSSCTIERRFAFAQVSEDKPLLFIWICLSSIKNSKKKKTRHQGKDKLPYFYSSNFYMTFTYIYRTRTNIYTHTDDPNFGVLYVFSLSHCRSRVCCLPLGVEFCSPSLLKRG